MIVIPTTETEWNNTSEALELNPNDDVGIGWLDWLAQW
jgi:hypothetical protein